MKKRDKKNKALLVVVLILCITIGYAALTTTLNITGNSEIKNAKWDIHFANLKVDGTSVEATTPATIDSAKTTVNYAVNLPNPGDSYSFTVDVVNEGTIDGMISTVSNTGLSEAQKKYVDYSITYANGTELKEKDGLKAGAKKNIKVKVKYKDDINPEDLPQEDKTLNLTFTVKYVQADDTVTPSLAAIMKAYTESSTDDYHNSTYRSKVTKIVTKTNINVPATAIEQWDVSAASNGSVVAYVEDDGSGNGTYQVTIGGNGKVIANEDSSNLFYGFSDLKEADLSNLDTSKVTSMGSMFHGCWDLTSLDMSKFDTRNVSNMSKMFVGCSSLTSLDVSKFNTSNVTNMGKMFSSCIGLTSLNLSNFDTSNVTNMSEMFYGCSSLTSLDLSSFDTSNVTNMSGMFSWCRSYTHLYLNNFNTGNVTDIVGMFNGCSSLTSVDLSSFNTSKVTTMEAMFSGCSGLTSLNLSNFDTKSVTDMRRMFVDCRSLTSLDLSSFNTSKVTNMSGMFESCSSLTSLDLSKFDTSKVTTMGNMFSFCSSLTSLDLSKFDTSNVTYMGEMFRDCSKLTTSIAIKNSGTSSYSSMFSGAATETGAKITVNYTSATSSLVDQMIATKYDTSNVVKGSLVS